MLYVIYSANDPYQLPLAVLNYSEAVKWLGLKSRGALTNAVREHSKVGCKYYVEAVCCELDFDEFEELWYSGEIFTNADTEWLFGGVK